MCANFGKLIGRSVAFTVVEFKNVTYFYEGLSSSKVKALSNISFKVEQGDFVCVIGHTGSGKTTLLKILNGLFKPSGGRLYINGADVWADKNAFSKLRKYIGFVFQNPSYQLFEDTVLKDIAFGPKNLGLNNLEIERRVKNAVDVVGISEDLLTKSPFELSGGQKKRVAIAGVMAMSPKILLLDEPVAGLDPKSRVHILKVIKKYNKDFGVTVILITHSMEDVYMYANKVLVLNKGELFSYDSVDSTFKCVDRLKGIGLDIPDISKVFLKLKNKGFSVPINVYSVDMAVEAIKSILLKRRENG